jgi:hypothetical protein
MSEAHVNLATGQVTIVGAKPHTNAQRRRQAKAAAKAARLGDPQARAAREWVRQMGNQRPPRRLRRALGIY